MHVCSIGILIWASFCLLIIHGLDNYPNSITLMFFVMLPLSLYVSNYLLCLRRRMIEACPIEKITDAYTVELKLSSYIRCYCSLILNYKLNKGLFLSGGQWIDECR